MVSQARRKWPDGAMGDVVAWAVERGWIFSLTNGSHVKLVHPKGGLVFTSFTPRGTSAARNAKAQIRRQERKWRGDDH